MKDKIRNYEEKIKFSVEVIAPSKSELLSLESSKTAAEGNLTSNATAVADCIPSNTTVCDELKPQNETQASNSTKTTDKVGSNEVPATESKTDDELDVTDGIESVEPAPPTLEELEAEKEAVLVSILEDEPIQLDS